MNRIKAAWPLIYLAILVATCVGVWSLANVENRIAAAPFTSRAINCTILLDLAVKPADLPVSCHDPRVLAHYDINQGASVSRTTSQHLVCALFPVLKATQPAQCQDLPPTPSP